MQEQTPEANGSVTRDLTPEQASSKVLSELLEATLSQRERSLSDHEWASLKSIVRQFEKSPLAFEDLVVALVEAFLRNRLSATVKSLDSITNMSRSIARTLCSDPVSRQRLMVFQQQLSEQQPS
jgi:hypothetical protein